MANTKVAFINMQIFMSKLCQNVPYLHKCKTRFFPLNVVLKYVRLS